MSNIDSIVNVQISIEAPMNPSASFSALLLVVPKAENAGSVTIPTVAEISSASDLADYGYTEESEAYKAALIAFAQDPRPEKVYVTVRQAGDSDATNEPIATTLERATSETGWYGFALVGFNEGTDTKAAATWAESNNKLFGFSWTGSEIPVDITSYNRTFAMYYTGKEENTDAKYSALALMAKCFGYDPGSETWALKTLAGIPVSDLTNAKVSELEKIPSGYYRTIANRDITQEGKVGSGEWIDIIRFRDWLISEIQSNVFSYLTSNQKVPYTNKGIAGVQNRIEEVLLTAQRTGGIDADSTDENGNTTKGFEVTVPTSSSISATEKKSRKLRNVKFTAKLAGAIHATYIKGTLTY